VFKVYRHRRLRRKELGMPAAGATAPAPASAQDASSSATTLARPESPPGKPEIPQA
jgi:hypothetical protein